MTNVTRGIFSALLLAVLVIVTTASAQEYATVEIKDLRTTPQRYWAKGIVFRDVLKEIPGDRTMRVDNRTVIRFQTEQVGEVFAFEEALINLRKLKKGSEYLFSGTVAQRGRNFFVVVRDATPITENAAKIPEMMSTINLDNPTSVYNRVFSTLQEIMKDVHKDLFAYATAHNIPVSQMFDDNSEHRDKLFGSIRTNLRQIEERSKLPADEFLVSLVVSMMAIQNGYVERPAVIYTPDETSIPPAAGKLENAPVEESVTKDQWDLSATNEPAANETPAVEPQPAVEPVIESAPAVESAPVIEPAIEPEPVIEPNPATESEAAPENVPAVENNIEIISKDNSPSVSPEEIVKDLVPVESEVEVIKTDDEPVEQPIVEEATSIPEPVTAPAEAPAAAAEPAVTEDAVTQPESNEAVILPAEPVVESPVEATTVAAPEPIVAEEPAPVVAEPAPVATPEIVIPETEPIIVAPAVETAPEVVAPVEKKPKAKKEKKKKIKAPEPISTETPPPAQDEIDYSQPMRVR